MDYILSPHPQGTPEWLQDRAGMLTGSNVANIYATIKSGVAAAYRDEMMALALERVTGAARPSGFVSQDMKWGTEQEPFARMILEGELGIQIIEQGFCYLPDLKVGGSVDGLIDPDTDHAGLVELKCPKSATHWEYWKAGVIPPAYIPQITHNVWVTGAKYAIFASYDPRMPENVQMFHTSVLRSDLPIEDHERKVRTFLHEVDALENEIRNARRR